MPLGSRSAATARERGSSTVEMVIVIPVFMMVILVAVQLCLWVLADEAVGQVATRSATTAAGLGGTAVSGRQAGLADAAAVAGALLVDPDVTVTVSNGAARGAPAVVQLGVAPGGAPEAGSVIAVVSGHVESILPWWQLTVRADRSATVQRFRAVP